MRSGYRWGHRLVVLQAVHLVGHRPRHGREDGTTVLFHLNPVGAGRPTALLLGDPDVDRVEPGHSEVVAGEGRRSRVVARGADGPEGTGGHITPHGAPDLPVPMEVGLEPAGPDRTDRSVGLQISHAVSVPGAGPGGKQCRGRSRLSARSKVA